MGRMERLDRAYDRARVEEFDATSRFVFFSDCHRADGSLSDEFTRNENTFVHALSYYFAEGHTYVELGDGDELWEHRQFRHIRRAHVDSFDAIRRFHDAGRLILIWGNHNDELKRHSWVVHNLYTVYDRHAQTEVAFLPGVEPCEAVLLRHRTTGQEIIGLHGHQGDFANDQASFVAKFALRYFWRYLHAFGFRSPASPAMNDRKRERAERDYHAWVQAHQTPLICGHTHLYSYPFGDEVPYFNAGSCVYPTSITAVELADGLIQLVRWRVVPNEQGVLQVAREVVGGPDPIERFALGTPR